MTDSRQSSEPPESNVDALILDLLEWIGPNPRPYTEVLEAWRTSCPRLPIWEDAMSDGLIERVPGKTRRDATIRVTDKGQALIR